MNPALGKPVAWPWCLPCQVSMKGKDYTTKQTKQDLLSREACGKTNKADFLSNDSRMKLKIKTQFSSEGAHMKLGFSFGSIACYGVSFLPGALAALLRSLSGLWSCTVWAWPQLPRPPKHLLLACKFSNLRDKVASQAVVLLWVRHQTHRGWEIVTLCNHPAAAVLEHPHSLSAPSSAARGTEHWLLGYLCGQILNEMQDTQEMFAPASSWQLQWVCNMG